MAESLLSTKLYIPPIRSNLVVRQRLFQKLTAGLETKLILVAAPAGFGKSTLLSAWARQSSIPVAWLSLDENDNDPARFLAYLSAALQQIVPSLASTLPSASPTAGLTGMEASVIALINELTCLSTVQGVLAHSEFALVLDDYHEIDHQAIHHALAFLIDHLPPNLHLILSTRADPPFPLARWRARGELYEIRQADLKFTTPESAEFLTQVMQLDLSEADAEILAQRTEGWIAGLQMAAISLRGRQDLPEFVKTFTGSNRYILDYLLEEIFLHQPALVQRFLLQTAILERMCAPLCDALLGGQFFKGTSIAEIIPITYPTSEPGNSSQLILEYLDHANLFLLPQDDRRQWYRYHHLFAQFLLARLRQMTSVNALELHRRAALWFEKEGFIAESISHAIQAKDYEHALQVIEITADDFLMHSQIKTLMGWLQRLPEALLRRRPNLCFSYAWTLLLSGYPLDVVQRYLDTVGLAGDRQVTGRALVVRAFIASIQGDTQRSAELSRIVAHDLDQSDSFLRSVNAWNVGISQIWSGDIDAGMLSLQEAEQIARTSGNLMVAVVSLSHRAEIMMLMGRLRDAKNLFQRALDLAQDHQGNPIPIAGMALVGLGEIQRENNEFSMAEQSLVRGVELAQNWGQIGALDGLISLAKLKQASGDLPGAQQSFKQAHQIAENFDTTELDDFLVATFQARFWIACGDLYKAQNWVEARKLSTESALALFQIEQNGVAFTTYYLAVLDYLTLVRLMIARKQYSDALSILDAQIFSLQDNRLHGLAYENQAITAIVLYALGQVERSIQVLEAVLELAYPEGYLRLFLDLGASMASLLYTFIQQKSADTPARLFAQKLLGAFEVGERSQELFEKTEWLLEPISEREFEVLELVAEGLSNQQIADTLVVALSTVKTHLNNIYRKLDVSKRTQAVARARELDLL